jgi:hypothetical protein
LHEHSRPYAPVEQTRWQVTGANPPSSPGNNDPSRDRLLNLYEKGKNRQWNSRERIDWSTDVDLDIPIAAAESYVPIHGSAVHARMSPRERAERYHRMSA